MKKLLLPTVVIFALTGVANTYAIAKSKPATQQEIASLNEEAQSKVISYYIDKAVSDSQQAEGVKRLWDKLKKHGMVSDVGSDDVNRPRFVNLQLSIEKALAKMLQDHAVESVVMVIHGLTPPTPLMIMDNESTEGIVASEIQKDPIRLATVINRRQSITDYLAVENSKMIVVYDKSAMTNQSAGIKAYKTYKNQHKNLIDRAVKFVPCDVTGATYMIKGKDGVLYMYSIKASQASSPANQAEWKSWFGNIRQNKQVENRFYSINEFLLEHKIDLIKELMMKPEKLGNIKAFL